MPFRLLFSSFNLGSDRVFHQKFKRISLHVPLALSTTTMSFRYATVFSRRRIGRALFTVGGLLLFSVGATMLILVVLLNFVRDDHDQHLPRFDQPPSWVWNYVLKNPRTLDGQRVGGSVLFFLYTSPYKEQLAIVAPALA